jgi:cholesterol oxidase
LSTSLQYEALIVGSGFGGSAMCARLSKKWPGKVLLLERGKYYPLGGFPRSPHDLADNVWCPIGDGVNRPMAVRKRHALRGASLVGMFDIRHFGAIDTVTSAGLGGGSLIYANVFLRPPEVVFEKGWPSTLRRSVLAPYYDVAQDVLGAKTIPPAPEGKQDRRYVQRTTQFQRFAREEGLPTKLADICVYFGNEYSYRAGPQPTAIGVQEKNRYGAIQTSCTYCGECDIGCNVHAKNTTDHNYLYVAQTRYQAAIQTLCVVDRIIPLNDKGGDDHQNDGRHGYRVVYRNMANGAEQSVTSQRVVVSAGTLGSTELLLRCRDVHRSLPRISQRLGQRFSGNGDFLAFALEGDKEVNSTYGPVITQYTDHHLFEKHDPDHAFMLQDASYPTHAGWAATALESVMNPIQRMVWACKQLFHYLFSAKYRGRRRSSVGFLVQRLMANDISQYSAVMLCMGLDKGNGTMRLNPQGFLDVDWPQASNMPLYDSILNLCKRFTSFIGAKHFLPMPTWLWPVKNNVTVHPLGGCALADSAEQGVVSAQTGSRGEVFGYHGLYVADGSLMPTALGANPAATITALSEWIAHEITGQIPTADL